MRSCQTTGGIFGRVVVGLLVLAGGLFGGAILIGLSWIGIRLWHEWSGGTFGIENER